jgi:hypothetical protein
MPDLDDLTEEEAEKFSKLLGDMIPEEPEGEAPPAPPGGGALMSPIRGEMSLVEQAKTIYGNAGEMIQLLTDHRAEAEERAQYIDDCDWHEQIDEIREKQLEVLRGLEDLQEDLEDYYR